MEAIAAEVRLADQSAGETNAVLTSDLVSSQIVGKDVGRGGEQGGRFNEDNVLARDEGDEVSEDLCLNLSSLVWCPSLSLFCLSCVVCKYVDYDSVCFFE